MLLYTAVFVYFLIYFYLYRYSIIFVCRVSHLQYTFKVLSYLQSIQSVCKTILIVSAVEVMYSESIFLYLGWCNLCTFLLLHPIMHVQICRHNCSGLCNMCILGIESILALFMLHSRPYLIFHLVKDLLICIAFCLIKLLRRAFLEQNSLHVKRMVQGIKYFFFDQGKIKNFCFLPPPV